jgi:catalase
MLSSVLLVASLGLATLTAGQCPYANGGHLAARDDGGSRAHVTEYEVDDSDSYLSSDVGGPIEDQESLRVGDRGPTLLEDFIFRQKIMHFDHERVCFPCLP